MYFVLKDVVKRAHRLLGKAKVVHLADKFRLTPVLFLKGAGSEEAAGGRG